MGRACKIVSVGTGSASPSGMVRESMDSAGPRRCAGPTRVILEEMCPRVLEQFAKTVGRDARAGWLQR
jgi:hypothetical protein